MKVLPKRNIFLLGQHLIYKKVKLAIVVEGDLSGPFLIATTPW